MIRLGEREHAVIVVAHPDDELLGAGGFLVREGPQCAVIAVADGIQARTGPDAKAVEERREQFLKAMFSLGVRQAECLGFYDQSLTITQATFRTALERALARLDPAPALCLTHCRSDLNADHRVVAEATLLALRPTTAVGVVCPTILGFRVDPWTAPHVDPGPECVALALTATDLETRWLALQQYESEVRDYPHPRSREALEAVARSHGVRFGLSFAEAYSVYRSQIET